MKFEIELNKTADLLTITLRGRLDTTTAPSLDEAIASSLDGVSALTIDCTDLAYVSSAGLRVLLSAQKKMKGSMKLTGVCELVMEVFEMTGFSDIFVIE